MTKVFLILALVLVVLTTAVTFSLHKPRTTEFTAFPTSVGQPVPVPKISHSPAPTAGSPTASPTTPAPSVSDFADTADTWELYRSKPYGFAVKYPTSITEVIVDPLDEIWKPSGNDQFPHMERAHVNFVVKQPGSTPERPIKSVKMSVNMFRNVDFDVFLDAERRISRFQREVMVDGERGYEFKTVIGDPADTNAVERGTRVLFVHRAVVSFIDFTLDYRRYADTFLESFKFSPPSVSFIVPKLGNISEFAPA